MALKLANNAISKLAAAIGTGDVNITVTGGDGAKFPALAAGDWFPLTLIKADGSIEIVKATARAGDSFTVTRAQEATVATSFSAGDRVELRMTVAALQSMIDATAAAQNAASSAQGTANAALPATGKAADADKLDGNDSTYYAKNDSPNLAGTPQKNGVALATVNDTVAGATKWAGSAKTISTAAPSGGADGDIWLQYQ